MVYSRMLIQKFDLTIHVTIYAAIDGPHSTADLAFYFILYSRFSPKYYIISHIDTENFHRT